MSESLPQIIKKLCLKLKGCRTGSQELLQSSHKLFINLKVDIYLKDFL